MILKSFLLGNLVSLCMKIINSVVVVGLYYGFLTTFSIGPSYLFLLRAHVMEMEEGEEGTEKKVSATTGFITGQLMMFISIYYAPLHLALGRPHTITVLALPYLLFHFFWNNHKHFFDYGSTTRNSMRNLSIQCVFLNNLIFQLFNYFILPSSMLARLVDIFMFRCNSKILFLTSSFVGWIIGYIFFIKWFGLVFIWIQKNKDIRKYIRSNKYLVFEVQSFLPRIVSIFLFSSCVYYLGRMPSPIFSKKVNPSLIRGEEEEDELDFTERFDNNRPVFDMYGNQENFKFKILDKNQKDAEKDEKPLVTLFFDYKRWSRPLRYIPKKTKKGQGSVRKEASQYFFYTCQSDGKQRISFTYPPSLSTFGEMIARRISLSTLEKLSADELYTNWIYRNKKKNKNLNNEFLKRIEALEAVFLPLNILETKTRLCNAETKNKKDCLVQMYDPFLNGMYRGRMNNFFSSSIINETSIGNCTEKQNKIHGILLPYAYLREYEHKIKRSEKKIKRSGKKIKKIIQKKKRNLLFNAILTDPKGRKKINEIGKKVPRWSYKLITELQQFIKKRRDEDGIDLRREHQLRSRKAKRVVVSKDLTNKSIPERYKKIFSYLSYLRIANFRRCIIKGSMRAQRRKTLIWKTYHPTAHSPLFTEIRKIPPFFSFSISGLMKFFLRNRVDPELKIFDYTNEQTKMGKMEMEKAELKNRWLMMNKKNERSEIELLEAKTMETWNKISHGRKVRTFLLIALPIFRRYILFPLLIIAKNIVRILLLQSPEWSEDFQDWNREIYLIANLNGLQLSKGEFPRNWLIEGIQIKIVYPFHLKPWHRSKVRSSDRDRMKKKGKDDLDSCFLTAWGVEADYPFGPRRRTPSFFKPIFKALNYEIRKLNFRVRRVLKKITNFVVYVLKEAKDFLFVKRIITELLKEKKIPLFIRRKISDFIPRDIYESIETQREKDSLISSQIIHDSISQIRSTDWTNYSQKMKNIIDITSTMRNQIEIMEKEKKKVTTEIQTSPNKKNQNNNGESLQNIWQIFKIKNIQLVVKLHLFFKIFIEKIYIDIFLSIINMFKTALQLFIESTKKIIEKDIYNNERNKERTNKTKQNKNYFIWTIKKALYNLRNSKWKSHIFFDLSYLSQAYVFFKLSQTQVINLYKLRSILQYNGPSFFLKTQIKDFFGRQGIFHSELRHKKLPNYGMNQWKNWLRGHYQYDLSQIIWSKLDPQKWRKGINQYHTSQNKDLNKSYSYEKEQLLDYKKKQNSKVYSLPNKENNFKKNYRYDLLSYKYIHSETKRNSYIYRSSLEANKNQENSIRNKEKFFNILKNIPIKNYLGQIEKNTDRKYLDWNILNFFLRKKGDIEAWTKTDPNHNTNIHVGPNKYQIIDQIYNNDKGLFYIPIDSNSNQKSPFFDWVGMNEKIFDWMGMNEKIFDSPISKPYLKVFSFPEFGILYQKYKEKPWFIPSKLLLLNLNINQNFSENKEIISFRPSNEKQYLELKNQNYIEEFFSELAIEKERLKIFFKNNYYFVFQLRWDDVVNQNLINHLRVYCVLVRMKNPRNLLLSYIQRKEINPNLMVTHNKRILMLTELMKKGLLILEPARVSVKNDGQFFMYQIIGISLIHKSKHQSNQRYREQKNVAKKNFYEFIPRHKRKTLNRDKNNYDLLVPENILLARRRRELRILIAFNFNFKNTNGVHRNPAFCKENKIKNWSQFLDESKHFDRNQNELIKLKFFFWPNYRLEDLACMNRYWFDTNNGSRLSMLRIYTYP
nr:hypothetical chloroplast RF1 [Schlechtendalia luzulifolia]